MEIIQEPVTEQIECDRKEKPEGWEDALTSEEFLLETRKMLNKKFNEKNKISSGCYKSLMD
jgi:hypothetical protein